MEAEAVMDNIFGVTALSLKHRQNSDSLFRLGETDTIWNLCLQPGWWDKGQPQQV